MLTFMGKINETMSKNQLKLGRIKKTSTFILAQFFTTSTKNLFLEERMGASLLSEN